MTATIISFSILTIDAEASLFLRTDGNDLTGGENFSRGNAVELQLLRGVALLYVFLHHELSGVRPLSFSTRPHVAALTLTLGRLCA